jgi:hypothetical protein
VPPPAQVAIARWIARMHGSDLLTMINGGGSRETEKSRRTLPRNGAARRRLKDGRARRLVPTRPRRTFRLPYGKDGTRGAR